MSETRNIRLAADYHEMLKIQDRPYVSWQAIKGDLPYAEEYLLNVRLRTYALSATADSYLVGAIQQSIIRITLWDSYPYVAPYTVMLTMPPAFHPDWYSKGTYCPSLPWNPSISLKDYVLRMLGSLRYDPALMQTAAPANYKALDWYLKRREDPALFPSDTTALTENTAEEAAALETAARPFREVIDSWQIKR